MAIGLGEPDARLPFAQPLHPENAPPIKSLQPVPNPTPSYRWSTCIRVLSITIQLFSWETIAIGFPKIPAFHEPVASEALHDTANVAAWNFGAPRRWLGAQQG